MATKIKISNTTSDTTVIDIEGVIGVSEEEQFEVPTHKVATYRKFRKMIDRIAALRTPEIIVNIRSTGGDLEDALLIYDTLSGLNSRIVTRCYGHVASAATVIAQAASDGCRELSANALYLIHRSTATCESNATGLEEQAALLRETDEKIATIYAARSGRDIALFSDLMAVNDGKGRWLSPAETLELGLADRIIDPTQETNEFAPKSPTIKERIGRLIDRISGKKDAPENSEQTFSSDTDNDEQLLSQAEAIRSEQAQNQALPTTTLSKEDPSPLGRCRSENQEAYRLDAENFRN